MEPTKKHAWGLLEDDQEWKQCLQEAGIMQTVYSICRLFATILFHCHPTSPGDLWEEFRNYICDDLLYKLQNIYPNHDFTQDEVYDKLSQ